MHLFVLAIFVLLLYSCVTDFLYREIKNLCVFFVFLCSVGMAINIGHINLLIPGVILFCGFLLTLIGMIGAGDIKLICALTIGMPQDLFFPFLFVTCCLGAPISIFLLLISKVILKKRERTVPFGIAISVGYITVMWGVL